MVVVVFVFALVVGLVDVVEVVEVVDNDGSLVAELVVAEAGNKRVVSEVLALVVASVAELVVVAAENKHGVSEVLV